MEDGVQPRNVELEGDDVIDLQAQSNAPSYQQREKMESVELENDVQTSSNEIDQKQYKTTHTTPPQRNLKPLFKVIWLAVSFAILFSGFTTMQVFLNEK